MRDDLRPSLPRQTICLDELLHLLGWSRSRWDRRMQKGTIPVPHLPRDKGDRFEFLVSDVERYLQVPIDTDKADDADIVPVEYEP